MSDFESDCINNIRKVLDAISVEESADDKSLVIDKRIACIVSRFLDPAIVADLGIKQVSYLDNYVLQKSPAILYICSADEDALDLVRQHSNKSTSKAIHVLVFPNSNIVFQHFADQKFKDKRIRVYDFKFVFLPLENDLFSIQSNESFIDLKMGQNSLCFEFSSALNRLQHKVGGFNCVRAIGSSAQIVLNGLELNKSLKQNTLILIDRNVDLFSVFMIPWCFSALVDTVVGMDAGIVDFNLVPKEFIKNQILKVRKFTLNCSRDCIYSDICDSHFVDVGSKLQKYAQKLKGRVEEKESANTIEKLRDFVDTLPEFQKQRDSLQLILILAEFIKSSLQQHLNNISEKQIDLLFEGKIDIQEIEFIATRSVPFDHFMMLICLAYLIGSIKEKHNSRVQLLLVHTYGPKVLPVWRIFEKCGILQISESQDFSVLNSIFGLINQDQDDSFGGYTPLSIKIIDAVLKKEKKKCKFPVSEIGDFSNDPLDTSIYIAYVGGVTLGEVSQLRSILKPKFRSFSVLATSILSSKIFNKYCV